MHCTFYQWFLPQNVLRCIRSYEAKIHFLHNMSVLVMELKIAVLLFCQKHLLRFEIGYIFLAAILMRSRLQFVRLVHAVGAELQ